MGREAVPLIGPGEAPFDASIEDPVRQGEADDGILPLYVRAQVHHEEPVPVALVVNGSVAAWTRTHAGRDTNAWAVIPESLLRPGRNELSLYLIEGDADHPVLQAIPSD